MPPPFHSTSGGMTDDARDQGWLYGGTLAGSFALHALIAALLIFGLPVSLPESEAPPAINVDLVPPPEPPEEAKPEPPAPEPPAAEQPKEAEPPPPPPPPAQPEAAVPPPPMAVLDPVYQYGEKDAGPADATDGNAAQDKPAEPPPDVAEEREETPEPPPQDQPTEKAEAPAEQPAEPVTESVDGAAEPKAPEVAEAAQEGSTAPEVLSNPGEPDLPALPMETQTEPVEDLPQVVAQLPAPRPSPPRRAETAPDLQRAQRIFSRPAAVNPLATRAMGNMPRGVRAGNLCVTELREQLLNGIPPYYPDLLPRLRLDGEGRVLNAPRTEFRMGGRWYNLSLRCTVDADATRVTGFEFRVGTAVPRSEWAGRKLPAW